MREVLLWLAAFLVGTAAFVAAVVSLTLWRLHRRNRVSASQRSAAPLRWLFVPSPGARLHRRLRNTVHLALLAGRRGTVGDLVGEIEQQAIVLDHHVAITSRLPSRDRGFRWQQLDVQVTQLEDLAARLVTAAAETSGHVALAGASADPLERIGERLDALEAARADLVGLERAVGLEPAPAPPLGTRPADTGHRPALGR